MRRFLMVVLFTGFTMTALNVRAEKPVIAVKTSTISNDTSKLNLRKFDQQKIKAYREMQAFKYEDTPPDNTWDRFWRWFWNIINSVLSNRYSGGFLKYLVIGILAVIIIFVVIKIMGLDLKIILGRSKTMAVPFSESLENIHEIDFNEEIQQAVAKSNYRLAVRLYYLNALKKLSDQSLIQWQPEKTNQTYIAEIADPALKSQFTQLTTQFEYIWYGEFFINKDNFGTIKNSFDQFNALKR